jgi:hypothetical protein
MGSFYVNACVKDLTAEHVLSWLRGAKQIGHVGPTVNTWTCFVTEALDTQDRRVIEAYGQALTHDSRRLAMFFPCHDEDVLWIGPSRDGQEVGEFSSAPGSLRTRASSTRPR